MYTKITKLAYVIPYLNTLSLGHNLFTNKILGGAYHVLLNWGKRVSNLHYSECYLLLE